MRTKGKKKRKAIAANRTRQNRRREAAGPGDSRAPARVVWLSRLRMVWYALGAVALSCALVACMDGLYQAIENSHLFALEGVEVRGNTRVDPKEILDKAAIPQGANILMLKCEEICRRIEAHPWIADASISRRLPHRLVITVKERKPVALLAARDLYYVDEEGVVFYKVAPGDPRDFPVLTGFREEEVLLGTGAANERVGKTIGLLRIIAHYPELINLSEINFDPRRGWTLYPLKPSIRLYLGVGDLEQKIVRLARVFRALLSQNPVPDFVDLSFPRQVIVKNVSNEKAVCATLKSMPSRIRQVGSGPTT